LGPQGPTINNIPVNPNSSIITPAPKEAHVLNDAILAAAHDLAKRERTRRKIIFVISDGKETGSTASYADVLKVLLSNNILVYGVAVDSAALPIYGKLQKLKVPKLNYTANILPKYANATGGEIFDEVNQSSIESAYARAIGDARNQYTLGYVTRTTPSSKYRQVEVRVDRPGCRSSNLRPCVDVSAKDGYYPLPPGR
jgi:VWFA-related protein